MFTFTNDSKLKASIAMLHGDTFRVANAIMFMIDDEYCVLRTVGSADKCPKLYTKSWTEVLHKFEEFANISKE